MKVGLAVEHREIKQQRAGMLEWLQELKKSGVADQDQSYGDDAERRNENRSREQEKLEQRVEGGWFGLKFDLNKNMAERRI